MGFELVRLAWGTPRQVLYHPDESQLLTTGAPLDPAGSTPHATPRAALEAGRKQAHTL